MPCDVLFLNVRVFDRFLVLKMVTPEKLFSEIQLVLGNISGIHPYNCDQCTFSCVQPYQLKSHMRTHTGEKPYKCDQCNYAAAWNVQLKEHKKAHVMETAVICKLCDTVFKNVNVLTMHQKKEHVETHPAQFPISLNEVHFTT